MLITRTIQLNVEEEPLYRFIINNALGMDLKNNISIPTEMKDDKEAEKLEKIKRLSNLFLGYLSTYEEGKIHFKLTLPNPKNIKNILELLEEELKTYLTNNKYASIISSIVIYLPFIISESQEKMEDTLLAKEFKIKTNDNKAPLSFKLDYVTTTVNKKKSDFMVVYNKNKIIDPSILDDHFYEEVMTQIQKHKAYSFKKTPVSDSKSTESTESTESIESSNQDMIESYNPILESTIHILNKILR